MCTAGALSLYMGWGPNSFAHAGQRPLAVAQPQNMRQRSYLERCWPGLGSGLLNPKNALFYASLFAVLKVSHPWAIQGLYASVDDRPGGWVATCWLMRLPAATSDYSASKLHLPLIERLAGVLLILTGQ